MLKEMVEPYMLRRTKAQVACDLPSKTEHVLLCRLTQAQRREYETFLGSSEMEGIINGDRNSLYGIDILRKICNHPDLILRERDRVSDGGEEEEEFPRG